MIDFETSSIVFILDDMVVASYPNSYETIQRPMSLETMLANESTHKVKNVKVWKVISGEVGDAKYNQSIFIWG